MADDIVVGSVAVDIVPDTTNFRRDLQAKVQGINVEVDVSANTEKLRADLDEITRPREAKITVNADTSAANLKLDEAARNRTSRIRADVDKQGLLSAAQGLSGLTSAALTLGPALIPLAATIGAIGIGLAAPLAIAGGGLTVFGFLTGFAIKRTEDQKKKIDQLAKSVETAKQSLANTKASAALSASNSLASAQASAEASLKSARQALANATTAAQRRSAEQRIAAAQASLSARQAAIRRSESASVAKAQQKVTDAVKAYNGALAGLTPAQKRMLDAQDKLKGAFDNLITTAGPAILGPVTKALNILSGLLPNLTPLIKSASGAITDLLDGIGNATKSKGFRDFVDTFSRQLGPDIKLFGHIFGNVFIGLGGILLGFNDTLGGPLLRNLDTLTGKFADFGQNADKSKKLQDFIGYVKDVGPQVGDTLGAVAHAIGHIVAALAPLGPPVLKVIEGIANAISGIPIPVLTGIAGAAAGLVAVSKLTKLGGGFDKLAGGGFSSIFGGAGFGARGASPAKPMYVLDVSGGGVAGGKAPGGIFGKVGTLAVGAGLIGAINDAMGPLFKTEFGSGLGNAVTDSIRAAFNLPDPALKGAGAKIAQGFFDALFNRKQGPLQTPQQVQSVIDARRGDIPEIRSTTDKVDALNAHLKTASRTLDLIGPHADNAFGRASRDVRDFSSKLSAIRDKKIQIVLNDQAAIRSLERLQAFRLNDKTLTIHVEQEIDRAVGPGGGIGHPTGPAVATSQRPAPRSGSGSGSGAGSGPLVNIQHANISDTHDIVRKAGDALRARAGGGVIMRPSPTPAF